MMDLDECMRALYFNPFPLIILDADQHVRMMNWPAETLLGLTQAQCEGSQLDQHIAPGFVLSYKAALREAAVRTGNSSRVSPTVLQLAFSEGNSIKVDCEVSVSAWQPSETLFELSVEPLPITYGPPGEGSNRTILHDAYYTLGLRDLSESVRAKPTPHAEPNHSHSRLLLNSILNHIDVPVYAVTADGSFAFANEACKTFTRERGFGVPDGAESPLWLNPAVTPYDPTFTHRIPWDQDVMYRSSILGEYVPQQTLGWTQAGSMDIRVLVDIVGIPVFDAAGILVGGFIRFNDISDRETLRQRDVVAKGEEYFRLVCDSMPQLVWSTLPDGYHDYYNKGWWDYTGLTAADAMGLGWRDTFHQDDMPEVNRHWSHSLRTGEPYSVQYRCRRRDGMWRWMLGRALPLKDSSGNIIKWFGTCTDVHETVEALYASRKSQSQLSSVINSAQVTLWAVNQEGIITVAEGPGLKQLKLTSGSTSTSETSNSPPANFDRAPTESLASSVLSSKRSSTSAQSRGLPTDLRNGPNRTRSPTMIGRSIYEIWESDVKSHVERALRGEHVTKEMEFGGRWYRTTYTPIRERGMYRATDDLMTEVDGIITGVVGVTLDITQNKRAQRQLEESSKERIRALSAETAAKEASRLKSEFLANMSHEIRTPIAGVIGMSELLCGTELSTEQRNYAENIQRSADALLCVINDILDLSKVETGKLDLENSPFRLNLIIEDTMKMLGFATQKKGLRFIQDTRLPNVDYVMGDGGRIRQVLTNLLTNAIKFTSEGSITLRVTGEMSDKRHTRVRFEVQDTGVGIPATLMTKLFRPFSQADSSTARKFGGTGLGLAISKNLVDLMKGDIGLDSSEGQGSTAWFTITFETVQAPKLTDIDDHSCGYSPRDSIANLIESPTPTVNGHSGTSSPVTPTKPREDTWILVAEDNMTNQMIALKMLKNMGFKAIAVDNGKDATVEVHKRDYSMVLMDCQMPEMDGYEATEVIRRSDDDKKGIPIIAMTASAIRGDRERCLKAGMSDYLAKPVKKVQLEAMILKWLHAAGKTFTSDVTLTLPTPSFAQVARHLNPSRPLVESPLALPNGSPPALTDSSQSPPTPKGAILSSPLVTPTPAPSKAGRQSGGKLSTTKRSLDYGRTAS